MRRLLIFLIAITTAFTIIYKLNGKTFSFRNYFENVSEEFNKIERPGLPSFKFYSYKEIIAENVDYYYFSNWEIYYCENKPVDYDCYQYHPHIHYEDKIYYTGIWHESTDGVFDYLNVKKYSEEEFENMPSYLKDKMEPAFTDNDTGIFQTIKNLFKLLSQPFKMIFELLSYIFNLIAYIVKILIAIGGGFVV